MTNAARGFFRHLFLFIAALAAGCGGGGDGARRPGIDDPIVVTVVGTDGKPLTGIDVTLCSGAMDCASRLTDASGTAVFELWTGEVEIWLSAYADGYLPAERHVEFSSSGGSNAQQLTLIGTDEIRLSIVDLKSVATADASSVVVDFVVDAVDRHGRPIEALATTAFSVPQVDCLDGAFGACVFEQTGADVPNSWWTTSRTDPVTITRGEADSASHYRIRFVLESSPGMFSAGRTTYSSVSVRLGADTLVFFTVEVRV